ncbi:MAG: TRAP transporter large permease subunit [Chitinophagaceae bacterium]|nr:TRAP transporter large permease subunit [Chitinophagaceae bacterium]
MSFLIVFACIAGLILLITWGKINAFIAFLIVSICAGIAFGLPLNSIIKSVEKGIGDTLGSLLIIITLGAMLGKLVAETGAAQKIAMTLMETFGVRYIQWALMLTGFIIGIPLFYGVGFVIMIPLIFSVVYQYKLPAVYIGLPMLASLSVTHGFLPPHPSPTALVIQFHGNMGLTLLYGLIIAIPAIIIAGPVFSRFTRNIISKPLDTFKPADISEKKLPGIANSFISSLLPVFLLSITTALPYIFLHKPESFNNAISFASEPATVMLVSLLIATFTLGIFNGHRMRTLMNYYADAVKDVTMVLIIIAGSGALKQVLADSGVSTEVASALESWPVHPLVLGWLIAAIIRVCVGSATVAGLTTAGIILPLVQHSGVDPNLMVLSIGAGSLFFSHVNDSGFWLFKEYFNLSIKDTFRTWSTMETIVSIVGLAGVLILNIFI